MCSRDRRTDPESHDLEEGVEDGAGALLEVVHAVREDFALPVGPRPIQLDIIAVRDGFNPCPPRPSRARISLKSPTPSGKSGSFVAGLTCVAIPRFSSPIAAVGC
jgi:hypothetical protein